jgi:starch-binding outer membrane protein, SusD/RagB family
MKSLLYAGRRLAAFGALTLLVVGGAQACKTDSLLNAPDPDLVDPADLDNVEGAAGLRLGALSRLRDAMGGTGSSQEGPWMYSGLLADEFTSSSTFAQNDETDKRSIQSTNSLVTGHFRDYQRVRPAANQAILLMKKWLPGNKNQIAELYFARGMAEMYLAMDFCNGVPLSEIVGGTLGSDSIRYSAPLTTKTVFERALASFDTGMIALPDTVTGTTGSAPQAILIRRALMVGRGRALLNLGRFTEAAAAVGAQTNPIFAAVPTNFAYNATFVVGTGDNVVWNYTTSNRRYAVSDTLEGNARDILVKNTIPFLSSGDPRIKGHYVTSNSGKDTTRGQDGQTYTRVQDRYTRSEPIAIVNGIDARLIEAEVQLKANDNTGFLATLNALRAGPTPLTSAITIGTAPNTLAPLTEPGTPEARLDLLFRERAFWTYGRGQRLNDMRRLARAPTLGGYGRAATDVFPEGHFHKGGNYGPDVNFPIPQAELNNPEVHTSCIDRLP